MKNLYTADLRAPLEALMERASRVNSNKPERYWYPLSVATYDVEEILAAIDSLCSFRTTMWEKTNEFERQFAMLQGSSEAIMVNSGSSADLLAAFSLVNPVARMLVPGDEVLVPSVTWPTQVWSLMMAGLRVRLVDSDVQTLNIDLDALDAAVGDRTRAVSLVHLMGNPCDMDRVAAVCKRHDLVLLEDCCEALGARWRGRAVGTFGILGTFSFFFSHHMTTMEGGAVTCDDAALSDLLRLLRAHGWSRNMRYSEPECRSGIDPRYMFLNWGFNVRPTEIQAAFGSVQLERLPGFQARRRQVAAKFADDIDRYGDCIRLMQVPTHGDCSWFALPLMVAEGAPFRRDDLTSYLESEGVETRPIVAGSLARHPVSDLFESLQDLDLPGADQIHDRGFYIGLHPFVDVAVADRLVETLGSFFSRYY